MFHRNTTDNLAKKVSQNGDAHAFEQLVEHWQNYIFGLALVAEGMNKSAAEELALNIFVDMWHKLSAGEYTKPVDRWMRVYVDKAVIRSYQNRQAQSKGFSCVESIKKEAR